jgi:hypothetical protein
LLKAGFQKEPEIAHDDRLEGHKVKTKHQTPNTKHQKQNTKHPMTSVFLINSANWF